MMDDDVDRLVPAYGPLAGVRVIEIASMGPGPHAAMQLADLGAEVVRIERNGDKAHGDSLLRGRRRIQLDLTDRANVEFVLEMLEHADILIEGFRPGVLERLGLGPDVCLARNPRLVYGRMTGWGQHGPLASCAGHDINYLALTGVLHAIGRRGESPVPPLNLVADFGGGSMLLLVGLLAALVQRTTTNAGQVVDAAMVDGVGILAQMCRSFLARGSWSLERGSNLIDGGAPFYDTYRCADDRYVAVGAIEAKFFAQLVAGLGLSEAEVPPQLDRETWPRLREVLGTAFATRTRDEWQDVFEGTDACVTPVLTFEEATRHPQAADRGAFAIVDGAVHAMPAPRFSHATTAAPTAPDDELTNPRSVLARWQHARSPRSAVVLIPRSGATSQ